MITPALIHNKLEDNKTIEFNGYITRKLDKQGRIELMINFIELLAQRVNKFSEEEIKKIVLINKEAAHGFKDLDAHIKNRIFHNRRVSVKIIMGRSGIIDSDIKQGMQEAIALYDIEYQRVSLSAIEEIINKIKLLDAPGTDIICVARGGGENLSVFEDLDICDCILERKTIIASAIGHAENVTLFEKLSDKKFITPTHFGNYLKDIYNSSVEEFENSKAKLVQDITNQLSVNYSKQIENLNDQLKSITELNEKGSIEAKKNHAEELLNLTGKLKNFEILAAKTEQEKISLHTMEIGNLKTQSEELIRMHQAELSQINYFQEEKFRSFNDQIKSLENNYLQKDNLVRQANDLASGFQKQLHSAQSKLSLSVIYVIIAVITGIIIGLLVK